MGVLTALIFAAMRRAKAAKYIQAIFASLSIEQNCVGNLLIVVTSVNLRGQGHLKLKACKCNVCVQHTSASICTNGLDSWLVFGTWLILETRLAFEIQLPLEDTSLL